MKHTMLTGVAAALLGAMVVVPGKVAAQQPAPAPDAAFTGAYQLAQIDEADLPVVIAERDGCREEVTAATLAFDAENQWRFEASVRATCGEDVEERTIAREGTFSSDGTNIEFNRAPADPDAEPAADSGLDEFTTGTLQEEGIAIALGERVLIFRR